MFNLRKWFKKEVKISPEPVDIHPKPKTVHKNPTAPTTKIEQKTAVAKPKDTGLSQKEINDLRQSEFDRLGIPYSTILMAEARGVVGIDPHKLARETESLNAKLMVCGFAIRISPLVCFECQLLYLDYQNFRATSLRTNGVNLPDHGLIDIIVLHESEKLIRKKHRLAVNPATGEEARKFQAEVKALCELSWHKSIEYQLRQQAQRRLRRERNLKSNEPLLEADVKAMVEKIRAEKAELAKKLK